MNGKGLLFGAALVSLVTYFWSKKNETKKGTKNANEITNDLSDTSRQAIALKNLMNVNDNFNFWTVDKITTDARIIQLWNIMLAVTNWKKLQSDFSALCKNEKTLIDCLQEATSAEVMNYALDLAKTQKVVTTTDCALRLTNQDSKEAYGVSFKKNTVVGALKSNEAFGNNGRKYVFINEFREDAWFSFSPYEITGNAYDTVAKLVNPV